MRKLRIQRLSRHRRTSGTGTFFEAHRLAKRLLDLHLAEREPFVKSGAEQQVMETAKVEGQDRLCHIVPLQERSYNAFADAFVPCIRGALAPTMLWP